MQQYLTYLCTDINETDPSLVIFLGVDKFYVVCFFFCRVYIIFRPKISAKTTEILAQDTSKLHKNALRGIHKSKSPSGTLACSCLWHSLYLPPDHFQILGDGPGANLLTYKHLTQCTLENKYKIVQKCQLLNIIHFLLL